MVVTKQRHAGAFTLLLLGLACALGACANGGADGGTNDGPECYSNADCSGGHECSSGICIPFASCGSGCRNDQDCLDNICRLPCDSDAACDSQGLVCGTDTKHCKPGQNPTKPSSQPQSGTGGSGSTGSGGSGTMGGSASSTGSGGASPGGAGNLGGMPGSMSAAGGPAGVAGAPPAPAAGAGNFAGRGG